MEIRKITVTDSVDRLTPFRVISKVDNLKSRFKNMFSKAVTRDEFRTSPFIKISNIRIKLAGTHRSTNFSLNKMADAIGIDESDEALDEPRSSTTREEFVRGRKNLQAGTVRHSKFDTGVYWSNYYKTRNAAKKKSSENHPEDASSDHALISDPHPQTEPLNNVDDLEKTDWEQWWVKSPLWRRMNVLVLILLVGVVLVQLVAGIFFLSTHSRGKIVDPYVCKTPNCNRLSMRLNESIDNNVSPCDNFYQFVCGNYKDEHDTEEYAGSADKACDMDNARLEFGKKNVLAEILKTYNGELIHDQPIKFYQVCRDPRLRARERGKEFKSFQTFINSLFGSLSELNSSSWTLQDMALNMTNAIGDFGFFKFDLEGYPYILVYKSNFPWETQLQLPEIIRETLKIIFPELSSDDLDKFSMGANEVLNNIMNRPTSCTHCDLPVCDPTTISTENKLDFKTVLDQYVDNMADQPKLEYLNEVEDYLKDLQSCINFNAFENKMVGHRHAIVGFWTIRILMWSLKEIDLDAFELLKLALNLTEHFQEIERWRQQTTDFQCFESLTRSLGYLPVHRYFERLQLDADQYFRNVETFVRRRVTFLARFWNNVTLLPHIDSQIRKEGNRLLSNEDPVNFMSNIPTPQDLAVENSNSLGNLHFGNDHLQNVLRGNKFSLKRARAWWRRKHDSRHVLLWNSNTFKLEDPYFNVRPIIENENAIFTPISFYLEPSVRNAGSSLVSIRSVVNMVLEYTEEELVKRRNMPGGLMLAGDGDDTECWIQTYDKLLKRVVITNTTFINMHRHQTSDGVPQYQKKTFGNAIALKVAHADNAERDFILKTPFWFLNKKQKRWVMAKKLKGLEMYTEEHLFFMSAVRNFCRQYPTAETQTVKDYYMEYITSINAALQQTDEFAKAWSCPPNSAMNPPFKCF